MVVDAADAGAGVIDDIRHRGGGESPRGEDVRRGVEDSLLRPVRLRPAARTRVGKLRNRSAVDRIVGPRRGRHPTKLAHPPQFSNTIPEDRLPGPRRVCCGVWSAAGSPPRCATSGHNVFRSPCAATVARKWYFVSGWRCGRTDSGGRLLALGAHSGDDHSGLPIVARRENVWCRFRSASCVASHNSAQGDRIGAAEGMRPMRKSCSRGRIR